MNSWNPVLNLCAEIKDKYLQCFPEPDIVNLEHWLKELDDADYNRIFEPLSITSFKEFALIKYNLIEATELWENPDSIYRECRSVVINLDKMELVLTPFKKFFNINELPENSLEQIKKEINNADSVEITNKLDGSMQNATWYDGQIFMAGSMALDRDNSWRLQDGHGLLMSNPAYVGMIKSYPGATFTFEFTSPRNQILVAYEKDELTLVGIRNIFDGYQWSYKELAETAEEFGVPHVDIENRSLEEILALSHELKCSDKEGWVLNIDGHMVKFKCDDYVSLHKIIANHISPNTVIHAVADGTIDDLLSKIPTAYRYRVQKLINKLVDYMREVRGSVCALYNAAPTDDIKTFMCWVTENVEPKYAGYVRNEYLKKDWHPLRKGSGGYKKYHEIFGEYYTDRGE